MIKAVIRLLVFSFLVIAPSHLIASSILLLRSVDKTNGSQRDLYEINPITKASRIIVSHKDLPLGFMNYMDQFDITPDARYLLIHESILSIMKSWDGKDEYYYNQSWTNSSEKGRAGGRWWSLDRNTRKWDLLPGIPDKYPEDSYTESSISPGNTNTILNVDSTPSHDINPPESWVLYNFVTRTRKTIELPRDWHRVRWDESGFGFYARKYHGLQTELWHIVPDKEPQQVCPGLYDFFGFGSSVDGQKLLVADGRKLQLYNSSWKKTDSHKLSIEKFRGAWLGEFIIKFNPNGTKAAILFDTMSGEPHMDLRWYLWVYDVKKHSLRFITHWHSYDNGRNDVIHRLAGWNKAGDEMVFVNNISYATGDPFPILRDWVVVETVNLSGKSRTIYNSGKGCDWARWLP